jgi:hypothetical protein
MCQPSQIRGHKIQAHNVSPQAITATPTNRLQFRLRPRQICLLPVASKTLEGYFILFLVE